MKKRNQEVLIKFNKTNELNNMIYTFENEMKQIDDNYYLKESENPYIYFLEHSNPKELVKKVKINNTLNQILEAIPVVCVITNSNYVVSTILNRLRHKITYTDTFNITCHINSYLYLDNKQQLEKQITQTIKEFTKITENKENPQWDINLYIIGDITGISIKHEKNRNQTYDNF